MKEAWAKTPQWIGPWLIEEVHDQGYTVKRDYEWQQRQGRGRPLLASIHMHIYQLRETGYTRDDSQCIQLQRRGKEIHQLLFLG